MGQTVSRLFARPNQRLLGEKSYFPGHARTYTTTVNALYARKSRPARNSRLNVICVVLYVTSPLSAISTPGHVNNNRRSAAIYCHLRKISARHFPDQFAKLYELCPCNLRFSTSRVLALYRIVLPKTHEMCLHRGNFPSG